MNSNKNEKECRTCSVIKPLSDYYKGAVGKYTCKSCTCKKARLYNMVNKDRRLKYYQKYTQENKLVLQEYQASYWSENKKNLMEKRNKRKYKEYHAAYWLKNKEAINKRKRTSSADKEMIGG